VVAVAEMMAVAAAEAEVAAQVEAAEARVSFDLAERDVWP
jgi:hypothetical protein